MFIKFLIGVIFCLSKAGVEVHGLPTAANLIAETNNVHRDKFLAFIASC